VCSSDLEADCDTVYYLEEKESEYDLKKFAA
jgi:hypothetical protein